MIHVKPLIWEDHNGYYFTVKVYGYSVSPTHNMGPKPWLASHADMILGYADTPDEAKEACEDHHIKITLATVEEVDR